MVVMAPITFQIPQSGFNNSKKSGDPLSDSTQKLYTTRLNALAKAGYTDIETVWKNSLGVIRAIKTLTGDGQTDADNMKRRQYLSAIFAVSPEEKTKKSNWLYRYYQKCLPEANKVTGKEWVRRTEFKE